MSGSEGGYKKVPGKGLQVGHQLLARRFSSLFSGRHPPAIRSDLEISSVVDIEFSFFCLLFIFSSPPLFS